MKIQLSYKLSSEASSWLNPPYIQLFIKLRLLWDACEPLISFIYCSILKSYIKTTYLKQIRTNAVLFHNVSITHWFSIHKIPKQKTQRMINHFIEQHLQLPPTRLLIKRTINHLEQADHQAGSMKYCTELHLWGKTVLPISIIILFQDNFFIIKFLSILEQLVVRIF